MHRPATVLITAALTLYTSLVHPKDVPYYRYGQGIDSCGGWVAERRKAPYNQDVAWVLGYVTGAGAFFVGTKLRHTDVDAIALWIDNYCTAHPLTTVEDAAGRLVVELAKQE